MWPRVTFALAWCGRESRPKRETQLYVVSVCRSRIGDPRRDEPLPAATCLSCDLSLAGYSSSLGGVRRPGVRVTTLEEEMAATSSLEDGLEAGSGSTREILDLTLQRKILLGERRTEGRMSTHQHPYRL